MNSFLENSHGVFAWNFQTNNKQDFELGSIFTSPRKRTIPSTVIRSVSSGSWYFEYKFSIFFLSTETSHKSNCKTNYLLNILSKEGWKICSPILLFYTRKSVLQNQENLFFTLTLCYLAQNHVPLFRVNLLSMLYNVMFQTITINTN